MAHPVSPRVGRSFVVGIVLLLVIGFVFYISMNAHQGLPFLPKTTARVAVSDVGSLREGDEVRQNSVTIGRVGDIEYHHGKAIVTLQLQGEHTLYRNARAAIWDLSALAQKFVELKPGTPSAGRLGDATIPATRNTSSADLYQLLNVFDPATRRAATSGIRDVGGGLAGHARDLNDVAKAAPNLLHDLGSVSSSMASQRAELPTLLRSTDRLASRFAGRQEQLARLIGEAGSTLHAVSVETGRPLRATLRGLPRTLRSTHSGLRALERPLGDAESALKTVRPGAEALGNATPDLRGVLREAVPPLRKVPGVADRARPAVDDLTQTLRDARPLAMPVVRALSDAQPPLRVLAPYTGDIVEFFLRIKSFVSESPRPGIHWARLGVGAGPPIAQVGGALRDPLLPRNPYPAPGEASKQRNTLGGGQ